METQPFHPSRIKSLKLESNNSGIDLLLQNVGLHLENLGFEDMGKEIYESVINHCDQIWYLYISWIDHNNISRFYKLVSHLNKHLKYLTLRKYDTNFVKKILKGLGQILLDTLEYLNLHLKIDPNDFKTFFNHCEHVKLKKLLVKNFDYKDVDIAFDVL